MARMRGGEETGDKERDPKHSGLVRLAQIVTLLVVFAAGVVIGLTTTSHIHYLNNNNNYLHFISQQPSSSGGDTDTLQHNNNNNCNCNCTIIQHPPPPFSYDIDEEDMFESFLHPSSINHTFSDDQLFWRASLVPKKAHYPYVRVPKLAFMFLTRGPLPMLPLWERFFQGHYNLFNIYIHAPPGYVLNVADSSPFYRRNIPSQVYNTFSIIVCLVSVSDVQVWCLCIMFKSVRVCVSSVSDVCV